MRFLILGIASLAIFTVFVTVFAASAQSNAVRLLPKWVWVAICLLVPLFGGLAYLTIGRPVGSAPKRTIAPDDDPEFLRNLRKKLENEDE